MDLIFKTLVNTKARCFKCKRYGYYDYQCPLESQHVRTVAIDEADDSKVVEDAQISSKTVNIIEDIAVDSDALIIDEIYMSFDSANDDVDEIVEPNTPTVSSQPFESPCAEYSFIVIPIDSFFRESPKFLAKVSRWFLIIFFWVV